MDPAALRGSSALPHTAGSKDGSTVLIGRGAMSTALPTLGTAVGAGGAGAAPSNVRMCIGFPAAAQLPTCCDAQGLHHCGRGGQAEGHAAKAGAQGAGAQQLRALLVDAEPGVRQRNGQQRQQEVTRPETTQVLHAG